MKIHDGFMSVWQKFKIERSAPRHGALSISYENNRYSDEGSIGLIFRKELLEKPLLEHKQLFGNPGRINPALY